jgi:hypothetical protein
MRSFFKLLKKDLATALSQQFPIKRATRCLLQVSPASRKSRKTRGAP